jgi:hypothetical protein
MHRPAYHGPVPLVPTATSRPLSSHDPVGDVRRDCDTTLIIAVQLAWWTSRFDLSHANCRRVPHCGECAAGGPSHVEVIPRRSCAPAAVCPRSRGRRRAMEGVQHPPCPLQRVCRRITCANPASLDACPQRLSPHGPAGLGLEDHGTLFVLETNSISDALTWSNAELTVCVPQLWDEAEGQLRAKWTRSGTKAY